MEGRHVRHGGSRRLSADYRGDLSIASWFPLMANQIAAPERHRAGATIGAAKQIRRSAPQAGHQARSFMFGLGTQH